MITTGPAYINWNYTYKCNFLCTHCYSRSAKYPRELTEDEYRRIASDIVGMGVFAVGFGGGEPLIRKDLFGTIGTLSAAGVDTHLTTNGWYLDSAAAANLRDLQVGKVLVSLDSVDPKRHDAFRAKPGSYVAATTALREAVSAGIETHISWVVNKTNISELEALCSLASAEGLTGVSFKLFMPSGFGAINRAKYELSPTEVAIVTRHIGELKRQSPLELAFFQSGGEQNCSCGVTQLTLRPNGDVAMCPYDDEAIANVCETPLRDVWLNNPTLLARRNGPSACLGAGRDKWPNSKSAPSYASAV
jgi:MoaA/NifB/PqqE/SkfB family radical SAM enzyme